MDETEALLKRAHAAFALRARQLGVSPLSDRLLETVYAPLALQIAARVRSGDTPLVGLAGAQGTGKSTLAALLQVVLAEGCQMRTVSVSLDDYYLPKAARAQLACEVHPLLATRGVPGTHDVTALRAALLQLKAADQESVELLQFSKAADDRLPATRREQGPWQVILFEGWCVGARPATDAELATPINQLERLEDSDASFRRYVNRQLSSEYLPLWQLLDQLVFIRAPSMDSVLAFRTQQEQQTAEQSGTPGMSSHQLQRFIQHFERITRQMLRDTPAYADTTLHLDEQRGMHIARQ